VVITASEIVGRNVVVRQGGKAAGKVRDLVVDQSGRQVLGLVVAEGRFRATRVAPWAGIQAIGPDSVILAADESIVKAADAPNIQAVLEKNLHIRGLKLQTTAGKHLGKIEDLRIDQQTGAVLGYELSGGMISDAFGGRSFLPTPVTLELGTDLAFISPEVEATIQKD
jgi:uncharacterized protein YrrD